MLLNISRGSRGPRHILHGPLSVRRSQFGNPCCKGMQNVTIHVQYFKLFIKRDKRNANCVEELYFEFLQWIIHCRLFLQFKNGVAHIGTFQLGYQLVCPIVRISLLLRRLLMSHQVNAWKSIMIITSILKMYTKHIDCVVAIIY